MFNNLFGLFRIIAVLAAAILLGKWFQDEVRKSRAKGEPWYKPYYSAPAVIIWIIIFILPVVVWIIRQQGILPTN